MPNTYAISVGVADVRRDPDPASELVTQALLNAPAQGGESSGAWTHVVLVDYEGWIQSGELAEPVRKGFCKVGEHCATPLDLVAVVTATHAPLYGAATGNETLDTVYLSTALPLLDTTDQERVQVALPAEQSGWLARRDISIRQGNEIYPHAPIVTIITYGHAFLNVPYLWGGTSWRGIDCSAFVQLCYRMGGYILPRDADQQHDALTHTIKREEMQEGDLIFFGSKSITHVAMALNNKEYIHAAGEPYQRVTINSFDPSQPHYHERLDHIVWAIKRVVS
ncbi:hypothetical protein EPA93_27370 [Ktedonosporobacter rubrisoli]|uniref:NlpC/P60 domain-containing protein n=1 Tax=Ktedonosporobacter rubrisoli TaxID=2509675 RepID=A0A4P6JV18_KTERU|nr:C40 family peptidase [Ktedonosporobacter rubrisoli]QBD79499.1 hypothetical protein EPA93_27370 [Ktedonosporobacter rubrisoli]